MRYRAHPQQAGFLRRFLAFSADTVIMTVLAVAVFFVGNEAVARLGGRPGEFSRFARALQEGSSISIGTGEAGLGLVAGNTKASEADFTKAFLQKLRPAVSEDEFVKNRGMSLGELEKEYPRIMDEFPGGPGKIYVIGGKGLSVIYEFVCGYAYFILFFRFGGRPLGKRLFGLKVIDLHGKPRLGWYQAFERTHGYAASALAASLGFLQVLWDHKGLTMHDRLAGTTVVRWKKPFPSPAADKPEESQPS